MYLLEFLFRRSRRFWGHPSETALNRLRPTVTTAPPHQPHISSSSFTTSSFFTYHHRSTSFCPSSLTSSHSMLLVSLFATSALAWQTSAFLVPLKGSPEAQIPPKGEELRHRIVDLDCPNCPFAGPDGNGSTWTVDDKPISVVSSLNILLLDNIDIM
jgi:hypothetical protein